MLNFVSALVVFLHSVSWAEAETIDVMYFGSVDLKTFACTDITRSSFVRRTCYDRAQQFLVVQLNATYYPYCELPAAAFEAFLKSTSLGQYYNGNIKGSGSDGPFDCRTHPEAEILSLSILEMGGCVP